MNHERMATCKKTFFRLVLPAYQICSYESHDMGLGLAIGIGIGAAIGAAMNNIPVGVGIGIALGVALGNGIQVTKRKTKKDQS